MSKQNYLKNFVFSCILLGFKGIVSRDFCFWFFSCISFPPDPEYSIKTVSNFFENSQRYSRVKEHHRYQRHRWQICHRYQRHRWQIFPPFSLALLIHPAHQHCRRWKGIHPAHQHCRRWKGIHPAHLHCRRWIGINPHVHITVGGQEYTPTSTLLTVE